MVNAAHSDCDGSGTVERMDALAIEANFGFITNMGSFIPDDSSFGPANSPQLSINLVQDTIFVQGTTTVTLSIELGSASNPVDSLYGLALTIAYDAQIVDQVILNWTGGILEDSLSPPLLFARADTNLGKIYLAASGIDHVNRMGHGTLGTIGIVMDDNIRINGNWNLLLQAEYILGVTASGGKVFLHPKSDTLTILTHSPLPLVEGIAVFPNPASQQVAIRSQTVPIQALRLMDVQGRLVAQKSNLSTQFEIFTTDQFAPGCYLLEVHTASGILRERLILQSY